MIFDVITVAIFLILIIVYAYRGAARALAGAIASVLAYVIAAPAGKLLSSWLYKLTFAPAVDKAVTGALAKISAGDLQSVFDSFPGWLAAMLKASGMDAEQLAVSAVNGSSDGIRTAVNSAVQPIATGILSALATVVLFSLLMIILRFAVIKPLLLVFEFPGLRGINHFFGGVIGLVSAFLLVSLLAYLVKLLMPLIEYRFDWLNESTIFNSFIFYHFYRGNIFSAVLGAIGL